MIEWWGPILLEYYAGTEGNGATFIASEDWLQHPGSVGRVAIGKLHIVDEEGNDLPPNTEGTIYFSGAGEVRVPQRARRRPRARASSGGRSTLGDVGYVDDDGYLFLTDRKAYMIISGGVNIYPREIEDVIVTHPKVADVAVFGIPDDDFGEQVKAVVQTIDGVEPSDDLAREITGLRTRAARRVQGAAVDRLRGRAAAAAHRQALQAHPAGPLHGQDDARSSDPAPPNSGRERRVGRPTPCGRGVR